MMKHLGRTALLMLGLLVLGTGVACPAGTPPAPAEEAETEAPTLTCPLSPRVEELAEDIRLLGVLNRLQLTPTQINQLLPQVEALRAERVRLEAVHAAVVAELAEALDQKRQWVLLDKPVPAEVQTALRAAEKKRTDSETRTRTVLGQKAAALIKPLLTAPQVAIATGADEAKLQALDLLDWLRDLGANEYEEEAGATAAGLADPTVGLNADLLLQIFSTARKLPSEEYQKSRDELAQRLTPLYGLPPEQANERLAAIFAHPRAGQLLKEKLGTAAQGAG